MAIYTVLHVESESALKNQKIGAPEGENTTNTFTKKNEKIKKSANFAEFQIFQLDKKY